MAKTILIPTDFTIESLNTVKGALDQAGDGKVNIILACAADPGDSITDLLFFCKSKYINSLQNDKFREACEILKNKYASQVNSFCIELFTGYRQAAFENFLQGLKVDQVFVPANYKFKLSNGRCYDLLPFCRKCTVPFSEISWGETPSLFETGNMSELYLMPNHIQPQHY
jgi:hypothetical protein